MTVQPWIPTLGSAALTGLLDRADRLVGAAGRADLAERLALARSWTAGRPLRVAVCARTDAEGEPLARALRATAAAALPGAVFVDLPGRHGADRRSLGELADVVLFASEARRGYGPAELAALERLVVHGVPVIGVLTGHESTPDLTAVLEADRRALRSAGIDTPTIPLLPVSTSLCEQGHRYDDRAALVSSGIPQLLEFLRDGLDLPVGPRLREAVVTEVRRSADQLGPGWSAELARLRVQAAPPGDLRRLAVAELDRAQQRSADWQIALSDGMADLCAQADFDLRERLRGVLSYADGELLSGRALKDWSGFDTALRQRIDQAVREDQAMVHDRAVALSRTVARALAGPAEGATNGLARPRITMAAPDEVLLRIDPTDPPLVGGGVVSRVVNGIRGSYGGILMVGVLTSLAGLSLISVYSVGAGVLLGVYTFFEDRRNVRERRTAEGRAVAARLLDDANFRAGDHQRTQLRALHRTLRDHFTAINDQRLRAAADAVRAADEGAAVLTEQHRARIVELEELLAELDDVRGRSGSRPVPVVAG